ncbi:MAG: tetratricopeptide repeat protein [Candidatus Margulisiibacteriota bacterium]
METLLDPIELKALGKKELAGGAFKKSQSFFAQAALLSPHVFPYIMLDYERCISQDPVRVGPRMALAGFLLATGHLDAALLELEEVLIADPQNIEAYNALGRLYISLERIDDAIALLERSIKEGVRDVILIEILAGAYLEKGRINEAIKFYEEILTHRPTDKQTMRILGELHARIENYKQAARYYQLMFSDDPEVVREVVQRLEGLLQKVEASIEIREILSDVYMRTIKPEAAVEKLKEILRLEPAKLEEIITRLRVVLKSYPSLPSAVLALAEALRTRGDLSSAVEQYNELIKSHPEMVGEVADGYRSILDSCPEQILARTYLLDILLGQNRTEEALTELGKMVEMDPSAAEMVIRKCREILRAKPQLLAAHVVLGKACLAKGDFQRAALSAEGVINIDKKYVPAYLLMGEAYANLNLPRKSVETFRTALTLDPYNLEVHEKYRSAKEEQLDLEIVTLKEKLQEDSWKLSQHLDLAKAYLEKGDRENAIRQLQLAQKDQVRAPLAFLMLGGVYRSIGRFDLAVDNFQKALQSANQEQAKILRFNIGTTYECAGEPRKAIEMFEELMQEDLDFADLQKRSRQLQGASLQSMRNKPLRAVITDYGSANIMAVWGKELRIPGRASDDVSISFGHEHNQNGVEYFMKGMYQAAEEEFLLAVQLDRRFAAAANNLGLALMKQGKLEEARLRINDAVHVDPASPVFHNNLGVVNYLLGRLEFAVIALERSFSLDQDSPTIFINLGDAYYFRQEAQKAIELYRQVGPFDPLADLAKQRLLYKIP